MYKLHKGGDYKPFKCITDPNDGEYIGVETDDLWAVPYTSPLNKLAGNIQLVIDYENNLTIIANNTIEGFGSLDWSEYLQEELDYIDSMGMVTDAEDRVWALIEEDSADDTIDKQLESLNEDVEEDIKEAFQTGTSQSSTGDSAGNARKSSIIPEEYQDYEYGENPVESKGLRLGMEQLDRIVTRAEERNFGQRLGDDAPDIGGNLTLVASLPYKLQNLDVFQEGKSSTYTIRDSMEKTSRFGLNPNELLRLLEDLYRNAQDESDENSEGSDGLSASG